MNEKQVKEPRKQAGYLCLIRGTTLTPLALTLAPAEWVNANLRGAVLLGMFFVGLSASAVNHGV